MLGVCSNCKTQIMDLTRKGQQRFLSNYCDHIFELSNGTLMRVGVCSNCRELLVAGNKVKKTAEKILDNHKEFWRTDEHAPRGFEMFEIIDPNTDEDKFRAKRKNVDILEGEKLQKQKDDFEMNHEKEVARIKAEKEVEEKKALDYKKKFERDVEEQKKSFEKNDKNLKKEHKDKENLISNFGLL